MRNAAKEVYSSWMQSITEGSTDTDTCLYCVSLQEEYRAEGISWRNIDYIDNTGCINLISKKPTALFHLLDEECK